MRRFQILLLSVLAAGGLIPGGGAVGQSFPGTGPAPRQFDGPKMLALHQEAPVMHRQLDSTAFFVDDTGYLLTARHAVENCTRVMISKENRRLDARVVALSPRYDIALLKTGRTLGLAAVFPRTTTASINDMVFAGAYNSLTDARANRGMIANARVLSSFGGGEAGHLVIDSMVTFGASGAPVLDGRGLVLGVISRRTMVNRVLAVGAAEAKAFLSSNNVRFAEDDGPQLAGGASRASRAASLSAQVTCLQN